MNGEIEPQAELVLYQDLPMYLSDEQKAQLDYLSPEEFEKIKKVRKALAISLAYYDRALLDKGISEEEIRNSQIHQFIIGSSHSPEVWLKMSRDTKNEDYQAFLEDSLADPLKYVPQQERALVERMLNRPAA